MVAYCYMRVINLSHSDYTNVLFQRKYLTIFSRNFLLRKVPSKMFDRVLNTPLEYEHFV